MVISADFGLGIGADPTDSPRTNAVLVAELGTEEVEAGAHRVTPLPFDPRRLDGISERMILSHHDRNYASAVRSLNQIEKELAGTTGETPGFLVAALRDRALASTNSVTLHESYFGNLGGDGRPGGHVLAGIEDAFGSFPRFEALMRSTGLGLSGGSGWAVLAWSFPFERLEIHGASDHGHALSFGMPILVMDVYEHAYQMDFGASADRYIEAFFRNVRWEEIDRRYEQASIAAATLGRGGASR